MDLLLFKRIVLIILNAFLIFYLLVAGVNLAFKLVNSNQSSCNPILCNQITDDANGCLIRTPGSDNCLRISGSFIVPSPILAYSLLGLSLLLAFYFSKRFYLSRILIVMLFFALLLFFTRVLIGSIDLSIDGLLVEFNKLGLNPPIFKEWGLIVVRMFNPKF